MDCVNDTLPLEYKLMYGCASRNLSIADVLNDSIGFRVFGVPRFTAEKEIRGSRRCESCPCCDNIAESFLISNKRT